MSDLLKINVNEIRYDPEAGAFFWTKKKGCRAAGQPAGSRRPNGYLSIFVSGKRYYAHRLAFLLMTGEMPRGVVDHINGDRADNRWSNLRDVTQSENMTNRQGRPQRNSKTGVLGVSQHACGKFIVQRNGKYLGLFSSIHDAADAYAGAANGN